MAPRFLLLPDVAETLNVSVKQARALVTSGELLAIQVGGRGQWRVEATELEAYIQRMYAQTRAKVEARAFGRDLGEDGDEEDGIDDDADALSRTSGAGNAGSAASTSARSAVATGRSGPDPDQEHGVRP